MEINKEIEVWIGKNLDRVGTLYFKKSGNKESSYFLYHEDWINNPDKFALSPDLPLIISTDEQYEKHESIFPLAIDDVKADGWAKKIITREILNKTGKKKPGVIQKISLSEIDYLMNIRDRDRFGALRFCEVGKSIELNYQEKSTIKYDLELFAKSIKSFESKKETDEELSFLQGNGTSLGGLRPKCSFVDEYENLYIGKFPSKDDDRSVTKGEVLALKLAKLAGINTVDARIVKAGKTDIAVIKRFDRDGDKRYHVISAASIMEARPYENISYVDIANTIKKISYDSNQDLRELWRRIAFNIMINNVDDHLKNHSFIYVNNGKWEMSPAYDLNPFPDKLKILKTPLSKEIGESGSIKDLLSIKNYFNLCEQDCKDVLKEIYSAVVNWKDVAKDNDVNMSSKDIKDYVSAFNNEQNDYVKEFIYSENTNQNKKKQKI